MLDARSMQKRDLDRLVAELDLVDPTDATGAELSHAPRLSGLAGSRIGLLDNRKPNAALLLAELGGMLEARFGASATEAHSKFIYSRPAAPELIDALAGCDAVITAIGD
jgi:hypothetical protein